jgi:hypothetical protein
MTATSASPSLSDTTLIFDAPLEAYARFAKFLEFDATIGHEGTGCVLWTGGTTSGHGKNARYPAFWFEGKRWYAHRWSAFYIHRKEIDGLQVDHGCCRTLCVEHVQPMPSIINRELQWIRVQVGLDPYCYPEPQPAGVPFYQEPEWYKTLKALAGEAPPSEDCPF